ncbi:MAG: GTPase Era [Fimbriimonadaceae bacterium]|nr:GTPase Era [Fimbriimonadaceae bacterium]
MRWTDDYQPPPPEDFEDPLADYEVPEGYRAGYITLVGRPNVGKSSLVNALVGERLAPVSPVPQTTRRRLLGIRSNDAVQMVFVDTPGLHRPAHTLGHLLVNEAEAALVDADLVLCVFDCTRQPGEEDALALQTAEQAKAPRRVVINKLDLARDGGFRSEFEALAGELPVHHTSAVTGAGLPELLAAVEDGLPEAPPFFPPDQVTDVYEREIAGELVREAAMRLLQQELPHAVAVKVESWEERPNGLLYLRAWLCVERESQKGIVIGKQASKLKQIGTLGREKLEQWLQRKVFLDLQVRVLRDWRRDERALRWLGLLQR